MKILKYLTYSLVLSLMVVSCDRHELKYQTIEAPSAEFQLHYFEPVANQASNYIDSVYVNGQLYSSVNGAGQLATYNGVPGGAAGRFFSAEAGEIEIELYRGFVYKTNSDGSFVLDTNGDKVKEGVKIYTNRCTLSPGKQNVVIYSMNEAPVVFDNRYPYWKGQGEGSTPATFDTDSVTSIMFVNLLFEKEADGSLKPYRASKLQYQYQDVRTKEWKNIGEPVGFGEGSARTKVKVVKDVFNSSGSCRVDYRILTEDGQPLKVSNSSGRMVDYTDWWTGYIGYVRMHFFYGIRTDKTIRPRVVQWASQ